MPLPVSFSGASSATGGQLDQNFYYVGLTGVIQGTISGTNTLVFTPFTYMPGVGSPVNNQQFAGIAANTNTSSVTFNPAFSGLPVYKDTASGPTALTGGEITQGNFVWFTYDVALNSGNGGFHLGTLPAGSSGTVTSIATGTGLTGGTITSSGTVQLANAASLTIKSNITGGSAIPTDNSLSAIIDAAISSTQGAVLYRGASLWTALAPGTAGQVLQSGGSAANPSWVTLSSGSVALALTATGSSQGTALQLASQFNQLTTVNSSTGVILATTIGLVQYVYNEGANTLNVYPPSGAQLNAAGTNTAVTLGNGSMARYVMLSATQGYTS